MKSSAVALAASLVVAASPLLAAPTDNLQKLQNFKQTGAAPAEKIAQDGKQADALRENLKAIKLPQGFKIELFAVVPEARHMAVEPSTGVVFVGTRKKDRKSTRLNSSHTDISRMPSSA